MEKIDMNDLKIAVEKAKETPGLSDIESKDWNGVNLEVRRTLSFEESMRFVDWVVSLVYDSSSGSYSPELKDFGIKKSTIDLYTNVVLPTDIEECYEILYETNLFEYVLNLINSRQLNMLVASVNEKLDYITQTNIDMINKKMNELVSVFNDFAKNFEGVDIEQLQSSLDSLQELGSQVSATITPEEK